MTDGNKMLFLCLKEGIILFEQIDLNTGVLEDTTRMFNCCSCIFIDSTRILIARDTINSIHKMEIYDLKKKEIKVLYKYNGYRFLFKNVLETDSGNYFGYEGHDQFNQDIRQFYFDKFSKEIISKEIVLHGMERTLDKSELPFPIFRNNSLYFMDAPLKVVKGTEPTCKIYSIRIGTKIGSTDKVIEFPIGYKFIDINYGKILLFNDFQKTLQIRKLN